MLNFSLPHLRTSVVLSWVVVAFGCASGTGPASPASDDNPSDINDETPQDRTDGTDELNECDYLPVVIRDFEKAHQDFELELEGYDPATDAEEICEGLIESQLGADGKPVFRRSDCDSWGKPETQQWKIINSQGSLAQWYTDIDGVNIRLEKKLPLTTSEQGTKVYDSELDDSFGDGKSFFPIENEGFGNWCFLEGATEKCHNYSFTLEYRGRFVYQPGQTFTFRGDDDLWLFVNGQLVIDLGGIHIPAEASVEMDSLGLEAGKEYSFDLFFAERKAAGSNFRIETNIQCFTYAF